MNITHLSESQGVKVDSIGQSARRETDLALACSYVSSILAILSGWNGDILSDY